MPFALQAQQDQSANIEAGRRIFTGSCSMGYCHGLGGVGGGGPKLAGRKFSVKYLTMVISDGVPETTMPSFKSNLTQEQLGNLILYVQSLANSAATESNQPVNVQEHLPTTGNKAAATNEVAAAPKPIAISAEDRELMGDASAGRALFFNSSQAANCVACHSISGRGGKIGPDLADVTSKSAKEILQSISEPNARVDEKFAALMLTLKDGSKITGVKRDEDTTTIRLYDTSSLPPISRSFLKADIAKTEPLKTSAMPGDYATKLSRQQLLDLVGFLKTAESGK
ncbi:MAG: c-type cytochrome [Acidobacteria bacterium]|nr:c-type cytochrome [Acidobacteriota bacterium]